MSQTPTDAPVPQATLLGQPVGVYTLVFTEMWERFSFYGFRALLTLYLFKGFMESSDSNAYTIYGAYLALVNMTPFFGGVLADQLLGARRAVIFGGLLMAVGQGCMMVANSYALFCGLALLIVGNGLLKPNVSKIVGTLYAQFPGRRDGGFTIFYMGINLGAALAPLLCGYVGEKIDWSYGFGLAGVGLLMGLAVLLLPPRASQIVIAVTAAAAVIGLVRFWQNDVISVTITGIVIVALLISAFVGILALGRGGLPTGAGAPVHPERLARRVWGLPATWAVYLGTLLSVPCFALLVCGAAPLREDKTPMVFIHKDTLASLKNSGSELNAVAAVALEQISTPAGVFLTASALFAAAYLLFETFRLDRIARHRMGVVLVLTCVSAMFWAFVEQAGSSMNNFADRNIDRVFDRATLRTVAAEDVGKTIQLQPTQEQVGFHNGDELFTLTRLSKLRKEHGGESEFEITWKVSPDNAPTADRAGMKIATGRDEFATTKFQSINPIFILVFGLVFTALWSFLNARGIEPSAPMKFAVAFLPLALGFAAMWYGAQTADARGMVAARWLLLGYLLHTIGELCLSPVGLSMVVKLSPVRLASTVIGGWFLASSVGRFLSGIISQFTNVGDGSVIPAPCETVHVYGNVFGMLAIACTVTMALCLCLVPVLKRWMHEDED